ncbi:hypothetical protein LPTSP3_g14070 [Leptospira kobayashii]|uniref:Lipoprotein n=2 Tax=Leptospira kobayashii TaxID=1917830 RepID=A0ABN6KG48_9LEPT|nr:hypothetical protein LPTSP3_g14070 [Leptospira kobayashii]
MTKGVHKKKTCSVSLYPKHMLMIRYLIVPILFLVFNCAISEKATRFNGMPTSEAKPDHYLKTTSFGLNVFIFIPVKRNAEFPESLETFSDFAKKNKGNKFRLIQKETTKWAFLLPPFSFILTPVVTELVGEVYD